MAITFRLFLETENEVMKFEDCTKEEIKTFKDNASKRLSNTLSQYYSQNLQELEQTSGI